MDLHEGPLVGFFLGTYYPLNRYRGSSSMPDGPITPDDVEVATFLADYQRLRDLYRPVAGDTIWAGSVFWGIPWMEALSGCSVEADHATGSTRSLHPAAPPRPEDIPVFDGSLPWVRKAGEFLDLLVADGNLPLGTTLMRGFSDILAGLFGSPDFVYRLVDRAADIEAVIDRLADLWIGFADYQIDRFPAFHGGTGSYFYNLWMPGRGAWIQEDAAALLSPQLFEPLVLPALGKVIDHLDSVIIHLHPTGYIPIDLLVETNLLAIELHIDKGGPSAEALLPHYRKIQSRKPLVIWGDLTDADLVFIKQNLDTSSLAVLPVIESPEQADAIWKLLKT
jgi:hypothetical protein